MELSQNLKKGIRIPSNIGIGDAIQFTSIPENYFKHFGEKLIDLEKHWIFDHNPYVERGPVRCDKEYNLWYMHCHEQTSEYRKRQHFLSNAESQAWHFGYKVRMNRPRLYRFEEFPFEQRETVVLHTRGISHGGIPFQVIDHVIKKYGKRVIHVGQQPETYYGVPFVETKTLWDLAEVISKARMFIGPDSGPSWIAACYPDVITKKVRMIPSLTALDDWVPLRTKEISSHWDDRCAMVYNSSPEDRGFTWSYLRI